MKPKTLGQIAYEADKNGGQQNFGPWQKAPELVKSIHENMAKAVAKHVLNEIKLLLASSLCKRL